MRLFKIVCLLVSLMPVKNGFAQNVTSTEEKGIIALLDSAETVSLNDPAQCLQYASEVLSRFPYKGNEIYHIRALLFSANSQKMLSRKEEALQSAAKAIVLSREIGDQDLLYRATHMKGTIFGLYDDQDSTLIYYQKAIDLYQPGFDQYLLSSSYMGIGQTYQAMNNPVKAEEYILKGYELASSDEYSKLFALASIIGFYADNNSPKYLPFVDTLANTDFYKNASRESLMAHFISFLLLDEATDEEKEIKLREVYEFGKANSSLVNQVNYGMTLYDQLQKMKKYEEGFHLLKEIQRISIEANNQFKLADITYALYENSKVRNDLKSALEYLEQHTDIYDQLLSEQNRDKIAELNIRFEAAQKDHEIEQQKAKIAQQHRDRNFFILMAVMLAALVIFVFLFFRNRAISMQRLAESEKVIHQQETAQLQKEKELAELTATLESQERERNRIARDLHDGLGSMMSGISSQIEYLKSQQDFEKSGHPQLVQLRDLVNEATSELRRTSYELMPAKLLRLGLEPAIRDLCLNLLIKNGIQPSLEINADLTALNPEQQLTLYRIIQELFNNIVKHSGAKDVLIQFNQFDDEISLVVEDDGKGFDVANQKLNGGLGLGSLSNRVNLLKGFLDIGSTPGEGTTVTVNFPIGA